jgi:hypothetical protein
MSMIKPMLAAAAIAAASLTLSTGARADANYAYCSATASTTRCDFQTYEQCQATVSGIGADCIVNPAGAAQAYDSRPTATSRPARRLRQDY